MCLWSNTEASYISIRVWAKLCCSILPRNWDLHICQDTHTFCSLSRSLSVSLCSSLNLNLCFLSLKSLFLSPFASLHLVPWILCQYLSGFLSISQFTPQSLSSLYSSPETDDPTSLLLLSSLCSLPSFILSKPALLSLSRSYLMPHYVCYNHMRASFTHHASRCDIAVGSRWQMGNSGNLLLFWQLLSPCSHDLRFISTAEENKSLRRRRREWCSDVTKLWPPRGDY